MKRFEDNDYFSYLQELINNDMIENEAAVGITKMIIDGRVNELSQKQKSVFKKYVAEEYDIKICERCGIEIPWCEMIFSFDNGGLCNYCEHMLEKDV